MPEQPWVSRLRWREALTPAKPGLPESLKLVGPRGVVADHIERATSPLRRMRGLLGRDSFPSGSALVISPCRQIHTLGMRFPVDAVFCDRDLVVLEAETLEPGQMSHAHRKARCCIELPAGTASTTGLVPGARLHFTSLA